jgi:hypothetical protein
MINFCHYRIHVKYLEVIVVALDDFLILYILNLDWEIKAVKRNYYEGKLRFVLLTYKPTCTWICMPTTLCCSHNLTKTTYWKGESGETNKIVGWNYKLILSL